MSLVAEQWGDPHAYHGECAVWFGGALHYVDMLAGDVLRMNADGSLAGGRTHVGGIAATLRPRASGGFIVGVDPGFAAGGVGGPGTTVPRGGARPSGRQE